MYGGQRTTFSCFHLPQGRQGQSCAFNCCVMYSRLVGYELSGKSILPFVSMQNCVLLHIAFEGRCGH